MPVLRPGAFPAIAFRHMRFSTAKRGHGFPGYPSWECSLRSNVMPIHGFTGYVVMSSVAARFSGSPCALRVTPSEGDPRSLSVQIGDQLRDLNVTQASIEGRHRTFSEDDHLAYSRIGCRSRAVGKIIGRRTCPARHRKLACVRARRSSRSFPCSSRTESDQLPFRRWGRQDDSHSA